MTAELKGIHAKTFQDLDVIKDVLKLDEEKIAELEKENTELKSLKDVADLIRLNNSHIVAMAQLNNNNVALCKENAELKADNEARKFAMAMSEKVEKKLREENARLNRLSDMQDETVVDLTKTCKQRREQLTKAKEIIKKLLYVVKNHLHIADVSFYAVINDAEKILKEE